MEKDNKIVERTYKFSLEIIKLIGALPKITSGYVIGKQIMKSGTSIGANVEEAQGAASKKDFINKIVISKKEARETRYWLRLLKDSNILQYDKLEYLLKECNEILRILTAIVKTSQDNLE